ncbi:chitinase-3-like protein 1 isoform X2 [Haemaphysalis longicornis]
MKEVVLTLVLLCAVSDSHHGTASAAPEVADGASKRQVFLCYWGSWSYHWNGAGKFSVDDIDASLCTHLVYAFAKLDNGVIAPFNANLDLKDNYGVGMYEKVNRLKETHPHLKTLLAVGGWNEGSAKYSQMASTPAGRQRFAQSAAAFLDKHGFDGLDLDWEYPAARGGVPQDKQNYVLLLQELRSVLEPRGRLLTAAVAAVGATPDAAYDVPAITRHLDYASVMAYDFYEPWNNSTGHCSPLGSRENGSEEEKSLNVESAMKKWLGNGADPAKLVLGLPMYGLTFTLANASNSGFLAPTTGPGPAGPVTGEAGYLGYNEICTQLQTSEKWKITREPHVVAPVAVSGNVWISYDDAISLTAKVQLAHSLGLAGVMAWSIETDDFSGACGGGKNPLLRAIRDALASTALATTPRPTVPPSAATTTAAAGVETCETTKTPKCRVYSSCNKSCALTLDNTTWPQLYCPKD